MYLPIPPTHPLFQFCCSLSTRMARLFFCFSILTWTFSNLCFSFVAVFSLYSETKQCVLKQILVVQLRAWSRLVAPLHWAIFVTWIRKFCLSLPVFTSACCLKSAYFFTTNAYIYKSFLLLRCFHFATFTLCCLKLAPIKAQGLHFAYFYQFAEQGSFAHFVVY